MRSEREKRERLAVGLLGALVVFDAVLWYLVAGRASAGGNLELDFLNIGQGDSELIQLPNGREPIHILVDGGPDASVLRELGAALPPGDRYIDLVLMTHPQLDHFGGFVDLLERYDVGAFLGNGRKGEIRAYGALRELLAQKKIPYVQLREGDAVRAGDAHLAILSPSPEELLSGELNDTCLVAMLDAGGVRALYTGDIGANVEERLARDYDLRAQVLKVPHHGSRFSSSEPFLSEVHPAFAVIEVGKNRYGHPTPDALERLARAGARIFRTDHDGTVRMVLRNQELKVFTGGIDSGNKGMLQRE